MIEAENADIKALEALIIDNPDLQRLESLIAQFNIFKAMGIVHQEARHSDFLSFLLDPSAKHGLGDKFLKCFLLRALLEAPDLPIAPIWIDLMAMDEAVVRREWQNIDILIEDPANRLVIVIENKILSGEHGNQLAHYLLTARKHFPDATLIPIFLTPEGTTPSDEHYISMTYDAIAEAVETTLETHFSVLGPEVRTTMQHYVTMLRRHIVSESEITELCRQIYRRHKHALDLILEHRPDLQLEIYEYLVGVIGSCNRVTKDHCTKTYIRFCPNEWEAVPQLKTGQGWTTSGRLLLFELKNYPNRLSLHLIIGPGPDELRQHLFGLSRAHPRVLRGGLSHLRIKWTTIFKHDLLRAKDFEDVSFEDLQPKIDKAWAQFLADDLPQITELVVKSFEAEG